MTAKNTKAPWAPQVGSERDDNTEKSSAVVPSGYSNSPLPLGRNAFGGQVGEPIEPKLGKGEHSDWEHQGFMVQPLSGGFAYPSSTTMIRREQFQLNEKDNFDPKEALTPRLKHAEGDGHD